MEEPANSEPQSIEQPVAKPEKTAYEKLPLRLRRMVDALVEGKNGKEAAILAGSKAQQPDVWTCRMRKRPDVQAAIAEREAEVLKEAGRSAAYVLEGVVETVERCRQRISPLLDRRGHQVRVENPEGQLVPAYVFDAKAVLKGLELLGNYHRMWSQKHEVSGPGGGPIPTVTLETDDPAEASRAYMEMIKGGK